MQQQRMAMEAVGYTSVFIRFFVMRTAPDEETLKKMVRDLESLLTTIGVSAFPARYSPMPFWKSTIPVGEVAMNQNPRNMSPSSLGTFFWPAQRRYMDEDGIYLGDQQNQSAPHPPGSV